jgi:hypothetical protein
LISIIELVSDPRRYHRRDVHVMGFLSLDFEGRTLYLHREDYIHRLFRNGVGVSLEQTALQSAKSNNFDKSYVLVEGRFDAEDHGHRDTLMGTLKDIKFITPIPPVKDIQALPENLAK